MKRLPILLPNKSATFTLTYVSDKKPLFIVQSISVYIIDLTFYRTTHLSKTIPRHSILQNVVASQIIFSEINNFSQRHNKGLL